MPKSINPVLESINCKAAVRNARIVNAITKTCDHSLPSKPSTGMFACLPYLTLIALRYRD